MSLDYLTGNSEQNPIKDNNMLQRFNDLIKLNDKDKDYILFTLDSLIRDAKARQAYST